MMATEYIHGTTDIFEDIRTTDILENIRTDGARSRRYERSTARAAIIFLTGSISDTFSSFLSRKALLDSKIPLKRVMLLNRHALISGDLNACYQRNAF